MLSHRASASFTVHKEAVSTNLAINLRPRPIQDAPKTAIVVHPQHLPELQSPPISPETVTSEERIPAVLERSGSDAAAGEKHGDMASSIDVNHFQEAVLPEACQRVLAENETPLESRPALSADVELREPILTTDPNLEEMQLTSVNENIQSAASRHLPEVSKPDTKLRSKDSADLLEPEDHAVAISENDFSAVPKESHLEPIPSPTSTLSPESFQKLPDEEQEGEDRKRPFGFRRRSISALHPDDPSISRSTECNAHTVSALPSVAVSSGAAEPSTQTLQYRAVSVCAAGVAVALFLVVMRRLALMLHGM